MMMSLGDRIFMRTLQEIQKEVAQKHKLGSKLVTGHKASYFEEAAKIYALESCQEQREICATTREEAEHGNLGWRGVTVAILTAPAPELK
jgi:hypothetical protein